MGLLDTIFPIMFKKHKVTIANTDNTSQRQPPGNPDDYFLNAENLFIYHKQFMPKGTPKALIFFCYGGAEFLERQEHIANYFTSKGYAVFLHDHQGHGSSEGDREYVVDFENYVIDFYQRVRLALDRNPALKNLPRFIMGHSMGGLIAVRAMQRASAEGMEWSGLILSAPALKVAPKTDNAVNRFLVKSLSGIIPKWAVPWEYGPVVKGTLSHDPACEEAYFGSKMIYHGPLKVNWAFQFMTAQDKAFADALKVEHPIICQHGDSDKIVIPASSKEFFEKATNCKDKTHIDVKDAWHEIMNEPEPWFSQVMEAYTKWIDGHLVKPYLPRTV